MSKKLTEIFKEKKIPNAKEVANKIIKSIIKVLSQIPQSINKAPSSEEMLKFQCDLLNSLQEIIEEVRGEKSLAPLFSPGEIQENLCCLKGSNLKVNKAYLQYKPFDEKNEL